MKRRLCGLLAALLLLAACGNRPGADGSSQAASDSLPGDSASSTSQSQSEPQPTVDYAVGTLAETSYASDYYGLHYTLPSGCSMMSREELDAMMEAGMGGTDGVEAQSETYGELLAVHDATGSNILLLTEKLEIPVDCQGYVNLANRRYEGQPGVTLVNDGKLTPVELGGLPFQKTGYIFDFGEGGGKSYSDTYLYKLGDYMLVLTTYRLEGEKSQKGLDNLLTGFEL